jgi:hypothetical protein
LQRHYDRSTCSWQSRARMVPEQVGIAHVGLLMGGLQCHCLQESRSGMIPEQVSVTDVGLKHVHTRVPRHVPHLNRGAAARWG